MASIALTPSNLCAVADSEGTAPQSISMHGKAVAAVAGTFLLRDLDLSARMRLVSDLACMATLE